MVSWQALHLVSASLGAGAPASHLPLQGAMQWLTVAELTWCVPKNTICTRLEHNLHRHCQCSRTCNFSWGKFVSLSLCLTCGQTKTPYGLQGTLTTPA